MNQTGREGASYMIITTVRMFETTRDVPLWFAVVAVVAVMGCCCFLFVCLGSVVVVCLFVRFSSFGC